MDQGSASINSALAFDDSKIKQEPYCQYDEEREHKTYNKNEADGDIETKTEMIYDDYIVKSEFPLEFGLSTVDSPKIKEEPENECAEDQATETSSIKQEANLEIIETELVIKQELEYVMKSGVSLESEDEETKLQLAASGVYTLRDGPDDLAVLKGASKGGRDDSRRKIQKPQHTKDHMRLHMAADCREKRFVCDVCDKRFGLRHHLMTHMLIHTGEKPFACDLCEYRTTTKSNLTRHMRTHTGQKPFACDLCSYRATQTSHLNTHTRMHVGGNLSSLKLNLRSLKTPHTGVETFVCDICNYQTSKKSILKVHMTRTHKEEKSFVDGCDYRTSGKSNLTAHKRSHIGEKPFEYYSDQLQNYLLSIQMNLGC